jgi:type VI secretion system protein ImpE
MTAEERVRIGDLVGALKDLQDRVRSQPSSAPLRIFLFQLLSVMGQWQRALTQLETAGELDAATLAMRATYREALRVEAMRAEIFGGTGTPTVLGQPEPWMAPLLEALGAGARAEHAKAEALRAQAFELAPATSGKIDGVPFAWVADGDSRLGPMVELLVSGRYAWIPFARLRRLQIEKPTDLRDFVWCPVQVLLANGGELVGLMPTRYPGTEASSDPRLLLSRATEWRQPAGDTMIGVGQRMFVTDIGEHALLDTRVIELDGTEGDKPTGDLAGKP